MSESRLSDLRNKMEQTMGDLDRKMGNVTFVDPARFNDPIALQTQWTSVHPGSGGANFNTQRFVQDDPNAVRFKATWSLIAFLIFFNLFAFGALVLMFIKAYQPILPWIIVGAIQIVGLLAVYQMAQPIIFSRTDDLFYKGWKKPDLMAALQKNKNCCRLSHIYALQMLSRRVVTQQKNRHYTYMTYELNLILNDGRRLFAVNSGKQALITEDARKLADFLGKPLWDAI